MASTLSTTSVPRNGGRYIIRDKVGNKYHAMRVPDGKDWTTENIAIDLPGSLCYDRLKINCDRYGRLYTWKTALIVCER